MNTIKTEGWIIALHENDLPVAIHNDTGVLYGLEYLQHEDNAQANWAWSVDWTRSPLDDHWGDETKLLEALAKLLDDGKLRVSGAIHGLPGACPLGAVFC